MTSSPNNELKQHVRAETHHMSQSEFHCKHCYIKLDHRGNPTRKLASRFCDLPTDMAVELMVHLRRRGFQCRARQRTITIEKPYHLELTVTGTWEDLLEQVNELPK